MQETDDNSDDIVLAEKNIREALGEALESADGERLTKIMESIPTQDALRHVSQLDTEERDQVVSLITPEAANTMIAVSIGGTVPLLLKRFGVDPAVASGPLLTTVTDMAGFFLVLSLATLFMPYLLM